MPTYEFRCPDGTVIEKFFKISEVPETIPSPKGDGDAVRMITGGAGLVFKGSGFYITDYGKDGKKDQRDAAAKPKTDAAASGASSDSASAAKSESKNESKSESKSESKGDAKSESKPAADSAPKSDKPAAPSAPAAPPKKD